MKEDQVAFFRSLNTIFFAMLMGQLTFAGIALFLVNTDGALAEDQEFHSTMRIVVTLVFLGCVGALFFIPKTILKGARSLSSFDEKLQLYRQSVVVRLALIEGPILLAIISYLLMGQSFYLILMILGMIIFVTLRPSPDQCITDLQLSDEEASELKG